MKLTKEVLSLINPKKAYAVFLDGTLILVSEIKNARGISDVAYGGAYPEWLHRFTEIIDRVEIFPVEDVKAPCTKTAELEEKLSQIEPKDKKEINYFHALPEGELKRRCLAEMNANQDGCDKAISVSDAIELCIDKSGDPEYWAEVLRELKEKGE